MLKIDFGSGYNTKQNFKTCDVTGSPFLDYYYNGTSIEGLDFDSVDEFYSRNVIHHIDNLEYTLKLLYSYLKQHGTLTIIECRKEYYSTNYFLDVLWYREIIPRPEIFIAKEYRDYISIMLQIGFRLCDRYFENEKEVSVWKK